MSLSGTKVKPSWIPKGFMIAAITIFFATVSGLAQNSSQTQPNQGQQGQNSQQQTPAEAGGPQGDIGPIAVPKKKEEPPPPPPVAQTPPPPAPPVPGSSVSQRLQQLDGMHASGAISDSEYSAKRQQIISSI